MARKVFISSSMSTDEEISEIAEVDQMAALMWPWLLTYFDDWGRAKASPREIKNSVFPANDIITIDLIKKALQLYQDKLIQLYEVGGKWYMCIPQEKWFKFQTHIRREKRENDGSKIPSPPDEYNSAHSRESARGYAEDGEDCANLADTDSIGCAQVRADARDFTPSPSPSPSLSYYNNNYNNSGHNPYKIFETNGFGELNEITAQMVQELEDEYTTDWVVRAMKVAIKKGEDKKNLGYVEGILKSWKSMNHPEPWTVDKEPKQQSNIANFPKRGAGHMKQKIPIAQPNTGTAVSPERLEQIMQKAQKLDAMFNGKEVLHATANRH
jgi:DnaD/phage-associated family protein